MFALRAHQHGGAEQLVYEPAPDPIPGIGDVLVEVRAASFTPTELLWPSTWEDRAGHDRRPIIPGHEVSGVVRALGYGTFGLAIGQAVFGLADWYRDGTAAELVAIEARNLAPKPPALSDGEAASAALAGLTAWQALFDLGQLKRDQTVLIHGAGGGVGTYAVQLAHAVGARVIGTGHAWARELVLELGADGFIDMATQRLDQAVSGVDLVLDVVGGEVHEQSLAVLKPGGTLVSAVAPPEQGASTHADVSSSFFVVEPNRSQLTEIARRLESGTLRAIVGAAMPLAAGRAAFEGKHGGGIRGKVVLQI